MPGITIPTVAIIEFAISIRVPIKKAVTRLISSDISQWIRQFSDLLKTDITFDMEDRESHIKCKEILIQALKYDATRVDVKTVHVSNKEKYIQLTVSFDNEENFSNFRDQIR